jgi:uncharacterized membrane protein YhhN
MFNVYFYLFFLLALTDWYLVLTDSNWLRNITKPLALLVLIVWFSVSGGWQGQTALIGVGLIFSLAGDIFLLKSILSIRPGMFQFGLFSFLVAQILYIIAFNKTLPSINLAFLVLLCVIGAATYFGARYILLGLKRKPDGQKLQGPVILYLAAISVMFFSASYTLFRPEWYLLHALLVAIGALLFYLSDTVLAVDAFVKPNKHADIIIMVTYHLAQVAIVSGMLLNAGK